MVHRYATTCQQGRRWNNKEAATGPPDYDGTLDSGAWSETLDQPDAEALILGGWNFQTPTDSVQTVGVELTSIGWTEFPYSHLREAGRGAVRDWAHSVFDFDTVDITGNEGSWSWTEVNDFQAGSLKARTSRAATGRPGFLSTRSISA